MTPYPEYLNLKYIINSFYCHLSEETSLHYNSVSENRNEKSEQIVPLDIKAKKLFR
jgi:hypothetical protein